MIFFSKGPRLTSKKKSREPQPEIMLSGWPNKNTSLTVTNDTIFYFILFSDQPEQAPIYSN